jgi:hypothetical protein
MSDGKMTTNEVKDFIHSDDCGVDGEIIDIT